MIYVIGGNYRMAKDFCQNVLHVGNTMGVRCFTTVDLDYKMRGVKFQPGDEAYLVGMVGMEVGPMTWALVVEEIDICAMGCAVRTTTTEYGMKYEILGNLQVQQDEEIREIEELRRKIMEAQSSEL